MISHDHLEQSIESNQYNKNHNNMMKSQQQNNIQLKQSKDKEEYYDDQNQLKEELNTANQILPAHKKIAQNKQKLSFKLNSTYLNQANSSRYNKSMYQSLKNQYKNPVNQIKNSQTIQQYSLKQQMGQFSQLLNQNKVLIYQRIKNQKLNFLLRTNQSNKKQQKNNNIQIKYFCSLFINPKLPKNQCKTKPIFEHLQKIYQIQPSVLIPDSLQFSSNFQGGNLFAVFKDYNQIFPTYQLFLQNDINTKGSTQWFNFKVINKIRMKAKFRINNFYKENSLYEHGMKILVSIEGQQWKRVGTAIKYGKNTNQAIKSKSFSLQFIHDFQSTNKSITFSYGYPYTFTLKLNPFIDHILRVYFSRKSILKSTLCKSTMGNQIYLLTISNNIINKKIQKPIIYIISRQHPGETSSSYVIEGFINFLLSNRIQAEYLRELFQFRIIPMVNVDGVINGNYRANISGCDVNRQWLFPSKSIHPEIYYLKQQIISNKKNTIFFLDIHAHSRKMNSFFYGCKQVNNQNKLYPFVCSKLNKFISYNDSSFGNDATKQTTGRVVIQKQLNLINSLTFQISFFGWVDHKKNTKVHFTIKDLQQIGMSLALGMYYTQINIKQIKSANAQSLQSKTQKQRTLYHNSMKIYQKWKIQIQKQKKIQQSDILSEGSSIDPEQFQLKKQQCQIIQTQNNKIIKLKQIKLEDININNNNNRFGSQVIDLSFNQTYGNIIGRKNSGRYFKSCKKQKQSKNLISINQNDQQNTNKKSNLFSSLNADFFLMSSRELMVRKLQYQLQQNKINKNNKNDRYKSIDEDALLRNQQKQINFKTTIRYHEKITQMKKNFNYCLNNNHDYQSYRSYYKSPTKKAISPTIKADKQLIINTTRSIFPKRHVRVGSNPLNSFNSTFKNSSEPEKKSLYVKLQKI